MNLRLTAVELFHVRSHCVHFCYVYRSHLAYDPHLCLKRELVTFPLVTDIMCDVFAFPLGAIGRHLLRASSVFLCVYKSRQSE